MNLEDVENKLVSPKNTEITESGRKRMRLNLTPSKSWSLIDNSTDQETLEEMGVSLLDPDDDTIHDLESSSLLKPGSKRKHNLENVNPNVNSAPSSAQKRSPKRSPRSKPCSPVPGPSGLCDSATKSALLEISIQDTYQTTWADEETPHQVGGRLQTSPASLRVNNRSSHVTPRTGDSRCCSKPPSSDETPTHHRRSLAPTDGVDTFSTLSDEVLLGIFKWLPKRTLMHCMLVCKRWQRIASDETFWQRLELGNKTISKGALGRILARKPIVVRLAASEIGEWHPTEPIQQTRIQYLDLSMCSIDKVTLANLLTRTSCLRKLSVESVALDDTICAAIGACSKLETLNMAMATGVTAEGLDSILEGCTGLQSLNISWCGLCAKSLNLLGAKVPATLLRLNIAGARIMTDDMLSRILSSCGRSVVELDVSDCPRVGASSVSALCTLAPRLEHLALSRCYLLPPHALTKLNAMPALQYVEVWGMLAEGSLAALSSALPRVQTNQFMHSAIARPTVGTRRTSIWGLRTRD